MFKIYTGVLGNKLNKWIEEWKKLSKWQNGFRKKTRIGDNIFIMQTIFEKYLKAKRGKIYWCFLDLEKAFDTVNRNKLWYKLRNKGISKLFVENLINIYENIKLCVRIDEMGNVSNNVEQPNGLRQGCNLSPKLFVLYIDDILNENNIGDHHSPTISNIQIPGLIFADDVCLASTTQIGLQKKINEVAKYCKKWDLKINIKKTKILIGSKGNNFSKKEKWYLENEVIETVKNMKYLGITINYKGTWENQNKNIWNIGLAALKTLRAIMSKFNNSDYKFVYRLYRALVESKMLYGIEIWGGEGTDCMLDRMKARFGKVVLNLPISTSNDAVRCEMGMRSSLGQLLAIILKYYKYILEKKSDDWVRLCLEYNLKESEKNNKTNKENRVGRVMSLLEKIGMKEDWYCLTKTNVNIKLLIERVKIRCDDINKQEAFARMSIMKSVKWYIKIKNKWQLEDYITVCTRKEKCGIAWWKLGIWKLRGMRKNYERDKCP